MPIPFYFLQNLLRIVLKNLASPKRQSTIKWWVICFLNQKSIENNIQNKQHFPASCIVVYLCCINDPWSSGHELIVITNNTLFTLAFQVEFLILYIVCFGSLQQGRQSSTCEERAIQFPGAKVVCCNCDPLLQIVPRLDVEWISCGL